MLEKDSEGTLTNNAKEGLSLMLDFFSLWLWTVNEINGTMHVTTSVPYSLMLSTPIIFLGNLDFPIGKGSIGYALSRKKGICISDALTDHVDLLFLEILSVIVFPIKVFQSKI